MILDEIEDALSFVRREELYPDVAHITGASTTPHVVVDGKEVLAFCSNNYLGMATHDEVKKAVMKGVEIYGMGSGGSRLVSGNISVQEDLEKLIAEFKGDEAAILFSTGYMANTGAIPALVGPTVKSKLSFVMSKIFNRHNVVLSDELNHASIVDGIRLAKAHRYIYKHKDMDDLERGLKKYKGVKKMIVTDGVFSMDGDIAPLPHILELAEKHDAIVFVDDAHASGILGDTGQGTAEHFHLKKHKRIITMGTFTKSFGGIGGFISGPKFLIDYLRITARSYIFSAPIPPAIVSGLLVSVSLVKNDPTYRKKLLENVAYLKKQLIEHKFNFLGSESQIIPIFIGDELKAQRVSRKLLGQGILLPAVRWPAVEKGRARLRTTLMSPHTKEHIDCLVKELIAVRQEIPF